MTIYSIYKITNIINNKIYIGYSSNVEQRFITHKERYLSPDAKRKRLYCSMLHHGIQNFLFEILYQSKDKLHTKNIMEPYFILEYNTNYIHGHGYNMTKGGDCGPGVTSENAKIYNNIRVKNGTHYFQSTKAKIISSNTIKNTNKMALLNGTHPFLNQENRGIYTGEEITVNGILYKSHKEAYTSLNLTYAQFVNLREIFGNKEINIDIEQWLHDTMINSTYRKACFINGIWYKSQIDAYKALNITRHELLKLLK